jgi:hypothetical protein
MDRVVPGAEWLGRLPRTGAPSTRARARDTA